eukprot:3690032-Amphidinium_carterae.1
MATRSHNRLSDDLQNAREFMTAHNHLWCPLSRFSAIPNFSSICVGIIRPSGALQPAALRRRVTHVCVVCRGAAHDRAGMLCMFVTGCADAECNDVLPELPKPMCLTVSRPLLYWIVMISLGNK